MEHDLKAPKKKQKKKQEAQHALLPDAETASTASRATADMQELSTLLAERDLLKKSLEARDADHAHALQSIRRSQDLAAEAQRLQRALAESQMGVAELEGRCRDLEQTMRGLLVERDESHGRERALQGSLAEARKHFQERVEQLGQSLETLQRLRRSDTPDSGAV